MMHHMAALRAVARDKIGIPNCADWRLKAASEAGLIAFQGWPSGHWLITEAGREAMREAGDEA